jgi:hypothetical protein
VDHHVSAIVRKLGVRTPRAAGLLERRQDDGDLERARGDAVVALLELRAHRGAALRRLHVIFNRRRPVRRKAEGRPHDRTVGRQSFSAIARVTTFDAGGNVFESGIARSTGERMSVDSIPERP